MLDKIYIVAGDEMQKLMKKNFPERKTIPFREDFSKGDYRGFEFDDDMIRRRSNYWKVSKEEYIEKMSSIINLDLSKEYILCFGEDKCCTFNLNFMLEYLKNLGYSKDIQVNIVNEYNLDILKEYVINKNSWNSRVFI